MDRRIEAAHGSHPEREGGRILYPGERTIADRNRSMEEGVSVDEQIWRQVCALAEGKDGEGVQ